jgi:uncharacterized protein YbjT (DUF2867 family)
MKILLTGTTGYIGQRLLPVLLEQGHHVVCCVRDRHRFHPPQYPSGRITVIEVDFLQRDSLHAIPNDIDAAYYLIHSMSTGSDGFEQLEKISAENFADALSATKVQQVIYLSGIINDASLSRHLASRKAVEGTLSGRSFHLTTLRAGIILGSGSASFEIIRDLVEKLPVMIAPKWLSTKTQPIAIRNVIEYLVGVLHNTPTYDVSYDIGGPEVLTYTEMLLRFAAVRQLRRWIITVPVLTPKLSSYWLYFVTSTSFNLASNLVKSMSVEVICRENNLAAMLGITLIPYDEAIRRAFDKIQHEDVLSSWTDALSSDTLTDGISRLSDVPSFGCFTDRRTQRTPDPAAALQKIWTIGGANGWYYADWLWSLRGFIDKLFGGVGLRRGRKNPSAITVGDSLDFWRVLYADREQRRLLLYAEMKLPGEAWLEFRIVDDVVHQSATFRPLGLWGRIYWYSVLPFHFFIFNGMLRAIASAHTQRNTREH